MRSYISQKISKITSLLLIVSLIFCGICYEPAPTYSSFACQKNSTSQICAAKIINFSKDFRSEESSKDIFHTNTVNQATKRIFQKSCRNLLFELLHVDYFPQSFYLTHIVRTNILPDISYSHVILMKFIHLKDGKKTYSI